MNPGATATLPLKIPMASEWDLVHSLHRNQIILMCNPLSDGTMICSIAPNKWYTLNSDYEYEALESQDR